MLLLQCLLWKQHSAYHIWFSHYHNNYLDKDSPEQNNQRLTNYQVFVDTAFRYIPVLNIVINTL